MKLFAIIKDDIVTDGWFAESYEEAVSDNPESTVVEVTLESGTWTIGDKYNKKISV